MNKPLSQKKTLFGPPCRWCMYWTTTTEIWHWIKYSIRFDSIWSFNWSSQKQKNDSKTEFQSRVGSSLLFVSSSATKINFSDFYGPEDCIHCTQSTIYCELLMYFPLQNQKCDCNYQMSGYWKVRFLGFSQNIFSKSHQLKHQHS